MVGSIQKRVCVELMGDGAASRDAAPDRRPESGGQIDCSSLIKHAAAAVTRTIMSVCLFGELHLRLLTHCKAIF